MEINLELIDQVRARTNCTYEEAKIALEKHDTDVLKAIIELEKNNKNSKIKDEKSGLGSILQKGFKSRFVIYRKGKTLIDISITVVIIILILTLTSAFFPTVVILVVLLFMGYKFKIVKNTGENVEIEDLFDNFSNKVEKVVEELKDENNDTKKSEHNVNLKKNT